MLVIGWGATEKINMHQSTVLLKASVPFFDFEKCKTIIEKFASSEVLNSNSKQFCAGANSEFFIFLHILKIIK